MSSRRQEADDARSNGSSESAEHSGTDNGEHSSSNPAETSGSEDDSSDNGEEGLRSDADAEASTSESDGESADTEHLPTLANKLPDSDIPATSVRVLFNKRLRGVKRKLEDVLLEFGQDRYAEIERRQAEKKGSKAEKKCRRQQRKYARVQAQAYLALVFPDGRIHVAMSEDMEKHPQTKKATELLTTSLEHMVQDQQLDMHMAGISFAAAAPVLSKSARRTSRLGQRKAAAPTVSKLARGPKPQPPSKKLVQTARRIFRNHVRPLQQYDEPDFYAAEGTAAKLKVCGGSNWKECRQQCGCQQLCAALRAKTAWPASLPCVDPNARYTSVDTQWANGFLRFAQDCGWLAEAELACQPTRQPLPEQAYRLRGTEPSRREAAPAPASAGINALLSTQLGFLVQPGDAAVANNVSERLVLGRANAGDSDGSGAREHVAAPAAPRRRRPQEAMPAGSSPPRRSGRERIPSRRLADDAVDASLTQRVTRPYQSELRLTFGDDEEGQRTQQLVWGAWRGEASNHIELIEERHFEFTTIGTLILPEHASYWRQLCDHQQLFTVDAHALIKSYLERCLPQGGAQEPAEKALAESVLPGALPASDMQFPVKQPFGELALEFSGEYLLASGLTDFPLLKELSEMLPADANERSIALHNKALIEYVVRVTDACIERALKKQHPLQSALKRERAVLMGGRVIKLQTIDRHVLHRWLMSRGIVVPGNRRLLDMQACALEYLIKCRKNLPENKKQLQQLLNL